MYLKTGRAYAWKEARAVSGNTRARVGKEVLAPPLFVGFPLETEVGGGAGGNDQGPS